MIIRKLKNSDINETCLLIMNVFSKFNSNEGSKKATQDYLNYYDPQKNKIEELIENFSKNPINFIAIENNKIIGIIRGRTEKITNLYVDGTMHKKGIGRALVEKFEKEAINKGSKKIKIKASLFAIPFYQKLGYKKTTGIRKFIGFKTQPMKKTFT